MASGPIVVDGVLDEPAWRAAAVATDFVQGEPRTGEPATEQTDVRVLRDATTLYIGAYLHDREPAGIIVNDIKKDFNESEQDDFEVLLDTFHDRQNGYLFITNVLGARADRQVANEGKEVNASWDAVWTVKTSRVADGWIVEMAIPFSSLRYDFATSRDWGLNFARRIRRKNETTFWSPVPRAFTFARVSVAGDLTGIGEEGAARDLRVKPYVAARTVRPLGGTQYNQTADVGGDLKWGITKGLTLDATVNPDFAQVEADEQQVNLTQFSLFLPEKREFFLENSGIFYVGDAARNTRVTASLTPDEDLLLFYSRRIGLTASGLPIPIDGGLRLTGNVAGLRVGALSMNTQRAGTEGANNFSVLRLRQALWPGSDVGILVQSRQGLDSVGSWNRVFGADLNIRFPGNIDWSSYLMGTRTPGKSGGQYAFRSSIIHEDNLHTGQTFFLENGGYFELSINPKMQRIDAAYTIDPAIAAIPAGSYAWTEFQLIGATDASRPVSISATVIGGGLWSGTQRTQQFAVAFRPSYHFSASLGVTHTEAILDNPKANFEATLWTARTNYSFTTNMFFDALAQYDPKAHTLNANLRFNLIHHPLSDLFIVLNEQRYTVPGVASAGRGVTVKFTQMVQL
ncbi:MAG: carbohydrate binding family 9 domain-containing protein [Gemmatimonadetes bacterium]|nr:carbohydrate binding family 9 domain-containing protein [Gemmatimonadota bacterium]